MNELIETYIRKRDELSALTKQYRAELDALEDQMRLKLHELGARSLKTEMGAIDTRGRMGAGTEFVGMFEYLIEINLANTKYANFIDED